MPYYCPDKTKDVNFMGSLFSPKKGYLDLHVKKCTDQTKHFSNISCASDREIEERWKYIQFNMYEHSEQINLQKRDSKPVQHILNYNKAYFLNLKTAKFLDLSLKRNEIYTFDSRLMKFEWDYSKYIFYSTANTKEFERPYTDDPKQLFFANTLFMLWINLSDQVEIHERSVYSLMDLVGDIGGVLGVFVSIIGMFVGPISDHSFLINMISNLFLAQTSRSDLFKTDEKPTKRKRKHKNKETKQEINTEYHTIKFDFYTNL